MNFNDFFQHSRYFGIDVGSSSVKLAEFKRIGDKLQVVNAKLIEFNIDPTSPEASKKDYLVKQVINRALNEVDAKSGNIALSISGQSVFVRFVRLPKVAKSKVEQIVKYEAQLQVPFPINEVIWDYQIFEEPQNPEMEVTLVAVKRDIIEGTLANFLNTNFNVEFIDVIPFVIYNLANFVDNYEGKIILEIGAKITNIIIVDKTKIWTRSILIAGDEITKAIANALQISFMEAEEIKKKEGILIIDEADKSFSEHSEDISSSITPILIDILTDVSKSIGYYKSQFGETKVFKEILLTGGTSKLRNIDSFFKNNLEINVKRLSILERLKPNISCELDESLEERLGVALGLALRHFVRTSMNLNLLPKETLKTKAFYKKRWFIFGSIAVVGFIMMTLNGFFFNSIKAKKSIISDMDNSIKLYSNYYSKINELQNQINNLTEKLNIIKDLSIERTYWLDILLELYKLAPKDIWLTHLEKSDNNLLLKGKTHSSFESITNFKNLLMKSLYFNDRGIEITTANLEEKKAAGEKDTRVFSIRAEFKKGFSK